MSLARHNARRDPGEQAIVEALEQAGAMVKRLSTKGMPDLLVGVTGRILLLEVKAPPGKRGGKSERGQRLNAEQERFYDLCRGHRLPVFVVHSPEEALRAIGAADAG